jgi:hypothetical protein
MSDSAGNTTADMSSYDLASLLSNPAVITVLKDLIDQGIQAAAKEKQMGSRTGMSIETNGLQSTDSPLTNSGESFSSNSSASACNAAIEKNKEMSEFWAHATIRDVYSIINEPDRYDKLAVELKLTELLYIR